MRDSEGTLTRERLLTWILIAAATLAIVVCILIIAPFLPSLTWALALAIVAQPVHRWICSRVGRSDISAGLAVLVIAVLLVAPLAFVATQIVTQAVSGAQTVQKMAETGEWRSKIESNATAARLFHWVEGQVNLRSVALSVARAVQARLGGLLSGTAWTVMQIFIALFALFFFFRDRGRMTEAVRCTIPLSRSETDEVFATVRSMIRATVFGQMTVAAVQGALGGIMFWILGIPAPALWALVMAVMALIPTLGAPVIWVPAALILAVQGEIVKAAILTGWGMLAMGLIDNLLYPYLVGREIELHPLLIFFAVVGGLFLFGTSGLVLGPVAIALTLALIDILRRRTQAGSAADSPAVIESAT